MNEVTILACTRRASEGKTVEVDYRGNVDDTMLDVLGGLRSDILFLKHACSILSHPALCVVQGRAKPDPCGPNSTEPNMFHHGETTYGVV